MSNHSGDPDSDEQRHAPPTLDEAIVALAEVKRQRAPGAIAMPIIGGATAGVVSTLLYLATAPAPLASIAGMGAGLLAGFIYERVFLG